MTPQNLAKLTPVPGSECIFTIDSGSLGDFTAHVGKRVIFVHFGGETASEIVSLTLAQVGTQASSVCIISDKQFNELPHSERSKAMQSSDGKFPVYAVVIDLDKRYTAFGSKAFEHFKL